MRGQDKYEHIRSTLYELVDQSQDYESVSKNPDKNPLQLNIIQLQGNGIRCKEETYFAIPARERPLTMKEKENIDVFKVQKINHKSF